MTFKSTDWVKCCFAGIIVAYALALPLGAAFGVIDDHGLVSTLLLGRSLSIDTFILPEVGRFFPLNAQEYNVISQFSQSPAALYAYHALQLVVVVVVMLKLLQHFYVKGNAGYDSLSYAIVLLLIFSTGFVDAWFRLYPTERGQFFFLLLFLWMFLHYQEGQQLRFMLGGLMAANIALYCKEPSFLMLGAFCGIHLLFGWRQLNRYQKIFDLLILLSAAIFVLVYYLVVLRHSGPVLYGDKVGGDGLLLFSFTKNTVRYLLSDPFLILLMVGLLAYRLYELLMKRAKVEPLYDALLISGTIYVVAFLKLNMWAYRYLLPAYAFSIFALAYFLVGRKYIQRNVFKAGTSAAFLIYLFGNFPVALHLISFNKNVPNNFQCTLDFLATYLSRSQERAVIYLDGVDRIDSVEIYHSFAVNLATKGLTAGAFDFKSNIPVGNAMMYSKGGDQTSPFTIYSDLNATQIEKGNLLIVTPFANKSVDRKYINELQENYDLLFHANTFIEVPELGLKAVIKYLLSKSDIQMFGKIFDWGNILQWQDFYVFRRR